MVVLCETRQPDSHQCSDRVTRPIMLWEIVILRLIRKANIDRVGNNLRSVLVVAGISKLSRKSALSEVKHRRVLLGEREGVTE